MIQQSVIANSCLEARSAAIFVQTASKYASRLQVRIDNKTVNAKSIMGIISLSILEGQPVEIIADGEDEAQAAGELVTFLENK